VIHIRNLEAEKWIKRENERAAARSYTPRRGEIGSRIEYSRHPGKVLRVS
jgi:hypothetical protein